MIKIRTLKKEFESDCGRVCLKLSLAKGDSCSNCTKRSYCIIAETQSDVSFVANVTDDLDAAQSLLEVLYKKSVTPVTLGDVIADIRFHAAEQ